MRPVSLQTTWKVVRQLGREFWLPAAAALAWALITWDRAEGVARFVEVFAPAFFLGSWAVAQVFRVIKQVRTETSFKLIEDRQSDLIARMERAAEDARGWATGGSSYAYFSLMGADEGGKSNQLVALADGGFPLHGVRADVVDIDVPLADTPTLVDLLAARKTIELGDMNHHSVLLDKEWKLELSGIERRFNIFFSAKNGHWVQLLRLRRANGVWHAAYRVMRETEKLREDIPAEFPDPESLNWK